MSGHHAVAPSAEAFRARESVRRYARASLAGEQALAAGMVRKAGEFTLRGSRIYLPVSGT